MHLMLDLETLSTASNAAVVQIGIVPFKLDGVGVAGEGLCLNVDPEACIAAGLKFEWSTLHWWMNQSQAARDTLPSPGEGLKLSGAVAGVANFVGRFGQHSKIWSNGAAFDIPIMENCFRVCRQEIPWKFYNALDVRTMKMLAPNVPRVEPTIAHNALADAVAQAIWVQNMYREIMGLATREEEEPPAPAAAISEDKSDE